MMLGMEERIRHLRRVALRAEEEGDRHVASLYRRMVEDARPSREPWEDGAPEAPRRFRLDGDRLSDYAER